MSRDRYHFEDGVILAETRFNFGESVLSWGGAASARVSVGFFNDVAFYLNDCYGVKFEANRLYALVGSEVVSSAGRLVKRIRSFVYKDQTINLNDTELNRIGNLVERYVQTSDKFDLVLLPAMDVRNTDSFGNSGSCWFTDYDRRRVTFCNFGGLCLQVFRNDQAVGRVWLWVGGNGEFFIANAYGVPSSKVVAEFQALFPDLATTSVRPRFENGGNPYWNNSPILLAPKSWIDSTFGAAVCNDYVMDRPSFNFDWQHGSCCDLCGQYAHQDSAYLGAVKYEDEDGDWSYEDEYGIGLPYGSIYYCEDCVSRYARRSRCPQCDNRVESVQHHLLDWSFSLVDMRYNITSIDCCEDCYNNAWITDGQHWANSGSCQSFPLFDGLIHTPLTMPDGYIMTLNNGWVIESSVSYVPCLRPGAASLDDLLSIPVSLASLIYQSGALNLSGNMFEFDCELGAFVLSSDGLWVRGRVSGARRFTSRIAWNLRHELVIEGIDHEV